MNPIDTLPEPHRAAGANALNAALGTTAPESLEPMTGGASGALVYRVRHGKRDYVLRMETRAFQMRNPHQYGCLEMAASAGVAPALHFLDATAGIVLMDLVPVQPLAAFPGGQPALVRAAAELVKRLQQETAFPSLADYRDILRIMLDNTRNSTLFAPGLLDDHQARFDAIVAALPGDAAQHVSSHNDPNVHNMLFDGERLWLIDWETAYRNDPLVDVAVLAENLAQQPELEDVLLEAWSGRTPETGDRARLYLMKLLTRLYYATLILSQFVNAGGATDATLECPSMTEIQDLVRTGKLQVGSPEFMKLFGKRLLAGFLDGTESPRFDAAMAELA